MNSKISKILLGVAASLLTIGIIFYLIDVIDAITDLSEYYEYGDYTDFYYAIRRLKIFQLLISIFILGFGIVSIVLSFIPTMSKKRALSSMFSTVALISLEQLISFIFMIVIAKKYIAPDATLNAVSIIRFVFIILTVLSIFSALILNQFSKKQILGPAFGLAGSFSLIIVLILTLSNGVTTTGFAILFEIFALVALLTMLVGLVFAVLKDNEVVANSSVTSTPVMEASKDSAEELLKLKKLLDVGAISQEEYEEKRKKYVDSL